MFKKNKLNYIFIGLYLRLKYYIYFSVLWLRDPSIENGSPWIKDLTGFGFWYMLEIR